MRQKAAIRFRRFLEINTSNVPYLVMWDDMDNLTYDVNARQYLFIVIALPAVYASMVFYIGPVLLKAPPHWQWNNCSGIGRISLIGGILCILSGVLKVRATNKTSCERILPGTNNNKDKATTHVISLCDLMSHATILFEFKAWNQPDTDSNRFILSQCIYYPVIHCRWSIICLCWKE